MFFAVPRLLNSDELVELKKNYNIAYNYHSLAEIPDTGISLHWFVLHIIGLPKSILVCNQYLHEICEESSVLKLFGQHLNS